MSVYNPPRQQDWILSQFADSPPSFTIKLYPEHWLINNSRPNLYHTPISVSFHNHPQASSLLLTLESSSFLMTFGKDAFLWTGYIHLISMVSLIMMVSECL